MSLSPYEEMVVAELEAQFTGRARPRLNWIRLAGPSVWLAAGVALLVAAHHGALVITVSDLLGFATGAITSVLSLIGYLLLLGCAFHLGLATPHLRPSPTPPAGTNRRVRPAARR